MPVQNVCWSDPSSAYLPRFCSPLLIFSFPRPPSLFGGIVKIRAGFNHFLRSLVLRLSPALSSPSACLWNSRTPAVDSRLTAQTVLGMRPTLRIAPSEHKTGPERLPQCFAQERLSRAPHFSQNLDNTSLGMHLLLL